MELYTKGGILFPEFYMMTPQYNQIDIKKNIAQLIQEYPRLGQILTERGIDCAACLAAQIDTLPDVVRRYNLDMNWLLEQIHSSTHHQGS
ncbi:MAG: hypothetical protein H7832_10775 [Magnetococcus sp. DMHC-6]